MAASGLLEAFPVDPEQRPGKSSWSSGLCSVCDDPGTCLFGAFCLPCLFGRNYARHHDTGCCGACWLYGMCPCLACCFASDTRRSIRTKYNLLPSPCNDVALHCFCSPCALCMEAREIQHQDRQRVYASPQ
ncbi:Cell number regulator 5 [Tetrabaena socialis]|uniref:Cell number regulator 5 n=1 Tax=Tetrabaena socialis TaxID=47790 RepID=A0A2J8AEA8_9CHLO|nr:Cell number regulator 5 [Tetrabaena socialis]|eukprot:PNH10858.1 Cell number regulator 5 [Tetrabaena socialis]